jgi:hypothetical protein
VQNTEKIALLRECAKKAMDEIGVGSARAAIDHLTRGLDATAPRKTMTPEQKAAKKAVRFLEGRTERLLRQLRMIGITAGRPAFVKMDNSRVQIMTEPSVSQDGIKVVVQLADGSTQKIDPFILRPDFTGLDAAQAKKTEQVARKEKASTAKKATPKGKAGKEAPSQAAAV